MGIELEQAAVLPSGLAYDRQWFLIDEEQKIISQKQFPKLCSLKLLLTSKGIDVNDLNHLQSSVLIPFEPIEKKFFFVKIKNEFQEGITVSKEVNRFFSDYLNTPCKLLYHQRNTHFKAAAGTFNHGHPFLLLSEASLTDLNDKLKTPVGMSSFRPNLVVGNCAAFEEDDLRSFHLGNIRFVNEMACIRCKMSNIDQSTGMLRLDKEPLKTLATYRKAKDNNGVCFGQYLSTSDSGVLNVGEPLKRA